jgi:hypothetical protein
MLANYEMESNKRSGDVGNESAGFWALLDFQPRENYKSFMSTVLAVSPTIGDRRIEELGEHPIWVYRMGLHFEQASSLEFSETLQFAARKTSQKIKNQMQSGRIGGGAYQSTHNGRAGGNGGQIELQKYAEQTYYWYYPGFPIELQYRVRNNTTKIVSSIFCTTWCNLTNLAEEWLNIQ